MTPKRHPTVGKFHGHDADCPGFGAGRNAPWGGGAGYRQVWNAQVQARPPRSPSGVAESDILGVGCYATPRRGARYFAVLLPEWDATTCGVPAATIYPPASPAPEAQIAQANCLQELKWSVDGRVVAKEPAGLIHAHGQHIRDALVAKQHLEGRLVIAGTTAGRAGGIDAWHEKQLHTHEPFTATDGTTSSLDVEGEVSRGVAPGSGERRRRPRSGYAIGQQAGQRDAYQA
jgi:hypothetical protein